MGDKREKTFKKTEIEMRIIFKKNRKRNGKTY